jgi:hypothetical protein
MYRPSIFTSPFSSQSSRVDIPALVIDPIIVKDTDDPSQTTNKEIREKELFERSKKKRVRLKYLPGEKLLKKIGKMRNKDVEMHEERPDNIDNEEIDDILKSFKL